MSSNWNNETKGKKRNSGIGIITLLPVASNAGIIPLLNLTNLTRGISPGKICLTLVNVECDLFKNDENLIVFKLKHASGFNAVSRVVNFALIQLKIARILIKTSNEVNMWFFFIGGENMILPMLTAKVLRKKTVSIIPGNVAECLRANNDSFCGLVAFLSNINYKLTDKIVLYSPSHIKEWHLETYENKVSIAHEHIIDLNKFKVKKKLSNKENLIGQVGRLSGEKGILNFINAISEILDTKNYIDVLIIGDGKLRNVIENRLVENGLNHKVKLIGWIPHDELPKYLNDLKLLVLPSYTEGLPNIMLESMACGTPVLATSVGTIPDIIKDGETGFLMENNSPECIAANVIRALEYPDLEGVAQRAQALVEREFTYEKAVERWKEILEDVGNDER